ncbi:MAG: hypothetical protein U0231_18855 [Nitrospiraceae bacterium]
MDEVFRGNKLTPNVQLQPGDVIFVPRSFVADMDKFFGHVLQALFPLVFFEQAIVLGHVADARPAQAKTTQTVIITPAVR